MSKFTYPLDEMRRLYEDQLAPLADKVNLAQRTINVARDHAISISDYELGVLGENEEPNENKVTPEQLREGIAATRGIRYLARQDTDQIVTAMQEFMDAFWEYMVEYEKLLDAEVDFQLDLAKEAGIDASDITPVASDEDLEALHEKFPSLDPRNLTVDEVIELLRGALGDINLDNLQRSEAGPAVVIYGPADFPEDADHDALARASGEGYPHYND